MPFKSEKQRRYLWANEPEIARDWTDTYGSRIKKDDGGVMSVQGGVDNYLGDQKTVSGVPVKWRSRPGKPETELAYITKAEKDLILKKDLHGSLKDGPNKGPGGLMSLDSAGGSYGSPGSGEGRDSPEGIGYGPDTGYKDPQLPPGVAAAVAAGKPTDIRTKEHEKKAAKYQKDRGKKLKQIEKIRDITPGKGTISWTQKMLYKFLKNNPKFDLQYLTSLKNPELSDENLTEEQILSNKEIWDNLPQSLKSLVDYDPYTKDPADGTPLGSWEDRPELSYEQFNMLSQVPGFGQYLKDRGMPGVKEKGNVGNLGDRYVQRDKITGDPMKDRYGNIKYGYGTLGSENKPGGEGPIYYPGYVPGGSPVSGGGGATAATTTTPSAFQESLTTSASSPFDYYVGQDPTAANLAWGEKFGVDPRTMYRTSWAADGGRIPAAYGGIMDTETGRRAYGFGSIFSKIGKAAKKVLKSPIGKAALIGGLGLYGANAGWFGATNPFFGKTGHLAPFLRKKVGEGYGKYSLAKLGILGAGALPFFMGGQDDDEDEGFDYAGAKNKYWDELMRIKAGAMAGTLDPTKFRYQGVKDGGRIGYYAGGQSTPSDYTMEDAMMTTTQDKLGGITDVMKQADLSRQGSVGQFYAAHGGSADDNNARLEARVKELQDEGLDYNSAMAQAMKELSSGKAQGGRIGYAHGSAGYPPVTMGQPIQAPQMPAQPPQRPHPMPAPQPNRMAGMPGGMNPMMNRPMMNPMMNPMMRGNPMMGGRRMAQEGGLMDLGGMEKDYRNDGGFVPLGGEEKADDVPARLSKNEFVFTADAVRGAGDGDIDKGAEIMENIMKNLEEGGQISEETQGLSGAQEMFGVSERLGEVL